MSTATAALLTADHRPSRCGVSPVDPYRHTMSYLRLLRYLHIKVHHLVDERDWQRIRVVGAHDRNCIVSAKEKTDKLFNWQRPTAKPGGDELIIKCYPGLDYVHHYALIIATYLSMRGRYRGQVDYDLADETTCRDPVDRLTVDASGADLVVVGWGLGHLVSGASWVYGDGHAWYRTVVEGHKVLYLGYLHSIWGDVAGRVVTRLVKLGARRVVYIGKVGSLDPAVEPNTTLATGNTSIVNGSPVVWRDLFGHDASRHPDVRPGLHVSSPSILLEGQDWLHRQHAAYVDPEIGHMGHAARRAGIEFGYLHVVSNNLAAVHDADLSNERLGTVVRRRTVLLDRIDTILRQHLRQTEPITEQRSLRP